MIKTNLQSLVPAREKFKRDITLLSHGYSMPDVIPDGKITIYPWDQDVDDWVVKAIRKTSVDQIPYEVIKKLVNLADVSKMVVGDVVTILLVARALARDSVVGYDSKCPSCGKTERAEVRVPDQLERISEKSSSYPGWDVVTLPVSQDVVKIRPLQVSDELSALERKDNDVVSRKLHRAIAALVAVNDGTPDSIEEALIWFRAIPPADFSFFTEQMELLSPHLGTEIKHKCDACGQEYAHELNLDGNFFR